MKTVKHGKSKLIWGCFSCHGVEPICKIDAITDQHLYVNILQSVMLPYSEEEMPLKWVFQQDNDPKHISRVIKERFRVNNIEVLEWPAQSPGLNLIEHLWGDIKRAVSNAKPKINTDLWDVVRNAWFAIPVARCNRSVDSMS